MSFPRKQQPLDHQYTQNQPGSQIGVGVTGAPFSTSTPAANNNPTNPLVGTQGNPKRGTSLGFGGVNNHKNPANNSYTPDDLLEEQKNEIREAFSIFDMNADGCLDFHETKVAFKALGFELSKREVLNLIHEYDTDGTNLLTYDNFYQSVGEMILNRDPLEEIRRAFKLFDEDKTGKISLRNLRKISKDLGENLTEEELRAMIDEFDLDEDGEINEEEFIRICTE
ncbi:CDC31 [[Candida] subhashii]|uniref:Cell division control protein 31 n=1 Tax=[Candida] subhashii TaxID=561895 RepID=A0A8J5QLT0_9ASCO|nr:CDC31 [[Candida] subhashii]KAG7662692.1 CDC31 [[Candida] subhashii]